jgi:hypothetical protein
MSLHDTFKSKQALYAQVLYPTLMTMYICTPHLNFLGLWNCYSSTPTNYNYETYRRPEKKANTIIMLRMEKTKLDLKCSQNCLWWVSYCGMWCCAVLCKLTLYKKILHSYFKNISELCKVHGCRPRGPRFDSQGCQIFWVAVGLEWGPLSPCEDKWGATWKKSSGSGLEYWDQRPWGIHRADHATPLYPQKLALNFTEKWRSLSWYSLLVG